MDFAIPCPSTEIEDTYDDLSLVLPAHGKAPAMEVERVRVSISPITVADPEEGHEPGDVFAEVRFYGHTLDAKGRRNTGRRTTLLVADDEETRWDLRRACALASLARHRVDPDAVVGLSLATFAEHTTARAAGLLAHPASRVPTTAVA